MMKTKLSEENFYKCLRAFKFIWSEHSERELYYYFLDQDNRIVDDFPKGTTLRIKETEKGDEEKKLLQLKIQERDSIILYQDLIGPLVFDFIMKEKGIPQGDVHYSLLENKIKIDAIKYVGSLTKEKLSTSVTDHFENSDFKNFEFHFEKVIYQDGVSDFHISLSGEDALLKEKYFQVFLKHMKIDFVQAEPVVENLYKKNGIARN